MGDPCEVQAVQHGLPDTIGTLVHGVAVLVAASVLGCHDPVATPATREAPAGATRLSRHGTRIHEPASLTSFQTNKTDSQGDPIRVSCATCHSLREPGPLPTRTTNLGLPHSGLRVDHGELACAACHAPEAPTSLHLADGTPLPMAQALTLCSQCHGPQRRDYDHGAHGGMRGYWDLSRGPRARNHCVDCHDPHAPAFPTVRPAPPPRDRFLSAREPHRALEPSAPRKGQP